VRTISLKLPEELDRALREMAAKRGDSRSALIREAIETYVRGSGDTVASRAGALAGSLEGPEDLSSNPDHMAGYGR
jgi:predicted transcriptional regulator